MDAIEVREDETASVYLVLIPGAIVTGRVVEEGAGRPTSGATVDIDRLQITTTDVDGRFRFEDLPEAVDEIGATKAGYADTRGNRAEPDREDFRLVLETADHVRGTVVEKETGEPVRAFTVKVRFGTNPGREEKLGRLWSRNSTEGIRFGADDGQFAIRELTVGISYTLTVLVEDRMEGIAENVEAWSLLEEGKPVPRPGSASWP
jgi:hypothetical protein